MTLSKSAKLSSFSEAFATRNLHIDMPGTEIQLKISGTPITRVAIGNSQNKGMRDYQEDRFGFSQLDKASVSANGFAAIVADGMGGLTDSASVSGFTVRSVISAVTALGSESNVSLRLKALAEEINRNAYAMHSGGGSTLAAVYCRKDGVYWCSVGDSRIYLFRAGRIWQVTEDADYFTDLLKDVLDGKITYDEADENPRKTALTHYIGDSSAVLAETNVRAFLPLNGDKLLICSDGVYNALGESEIAQIVKASPQEAAEHIVSEVLSKGYVNQDNFTSVILGFSES